MRLKVVTSGLMIFGLAMLFGLPIMFGRIPRGERTRAAQEAVLATGIYIVVMFFVWLAVIVCAWLIIRAARRELVETAQENMKSFVEGTLRDHARSKGNPDQEVEGFEDEIGGGRSQGDET